MVYFFAPMEGLTDSVYRRLHHRYFGGADAYYMPFISPTVHRALTAREARELPEAGAEPFCAVPQILTKSPEDFLWIAQQCALRGYREINLNCGCPSGTVVAKKKGSGMLADPDALDRFLDTVFRSSPLPVSVKTRLGMEDAEDWPELLAIYNRYPICRLIVHPRVRSQFYKGSINGEMFRYTAENCKNPLCYNGDLRTKEDIEAFSRAFPEISSVMIGRGLIADPGMLLPGGTDIPLLEEFYEELLQQYQILFGGSRNAMFRLKENWSYLLPTFEGSEKLAKRLRKATDVEEYRAITAEIFHTLPRKSVFPRLP